MYDLLLKLFPIHRSITGNGVRDTLRIIQEILPDLMIHEVPTGTKAFDWVVPQEWNAVHAYIETPFGETICDTQVNNLHLVGYSRPFKATVTLEELQRHLHSLPDQPDAIPYVTSYYKRDWGFCISHKERKGLIKGLYHVHIDTELKDGSLTYADLVIPGESEEEILLSTYICHPSMANDNLSGVVVAVELAKWLQERKNRYTYRIVFVPETIGSIVYLSKHLKELQQKVIAGYVLTCLGDEGDYSYICTLNDNTLADKAVESVEGNFGSSYYGFHHRGSDERQYNYPGVDLPIGVLCRSKFDAFEEYHTSRDNTEYVTPKGLQGGFEYVKTILEALEMNRTYANTTLCEPNLGKRGLYPTTSTKNTAEQVMRILDVLTYCDGKRDLLEIANNHMNIDVAELYGIAERLKEHGLLEEVKHGKSQSIVETV